MDAAAEPGRNPVSKHQIQPEYGDEQTDAGRDGWTRLARPNSQARTGTGECSFSLFSWPRAGLATLSGWSILCYMWWPYIHTYIHTWTSEDLTLCRLKSGFFFCDARVPLFTSHGPNVAAPSLLGLLPEFLQLVAHPRSSRPMPCRCRSWPCQSFLVLPFDQNFTCGGHDRIKKITRKGEIALKGIFVEKTANSI